jgi:hypothetical protein
MKKQSMQSVIKPEFNSILYTVYICGDRPTNKSHRALKGNFTCNPRETIRIDSTQIRGGPVMVNQGGWTTVRLCPKILKFKPSLKGNYQA